LVNILPRMAKQTRKVTVYICERCEHEWIPRDADPKSEPRVCPKCKSPYWNKPRRNAKAA
jgi:DNA-directed RNA polymerase subunit RPC12/RpoP